MTNMLSDENEFEDVVFRFVNMKNKNKGDIFQRRFKSMFGIDYCLALKVWSDLKSSNVLHNTKYNPKHLLMTLYFLKSYGIERQISNMFEVDEKIYRKWIWIYIKALNKLSRFYVSYWIQIDKLLLTHRTNIWHKII